MTIGDPTSLLDSVLTAQQTRAEIGVTMLKKAQDQMTRQGEALIRMLEQVPNCSDCSLVPLLDIYA